MIESVIVPFKWILKTKAQYKSFQLR